MFFKRDSSIAGNYWPWPSNTSYRIRSPTDVTDQGYFGESVAIDFPYVVIGEPHSPYPVTTYKKGSVHIYKLENNSLTWKKTINGEDDQDQFGLKVAISALTGSNANGGNYHIIVGTGGDRRNNSQSAYIYEGSDGNWSKKKLS